MKSWLITVFLCVTACGYIMVNKTIIVNSLFSTLHQSNIKSVYASVDPNLNSEFIVNVTLEELIKNLKELTPGSCAFNSYLYEKAIDQFGSSNNDPKIILLIKTKAVDICPEIMI